MTGYPDQSLRILRRELKDPQLKCHWLAGDGSDRSYFRIVMSDGSTRVLMQLSDSDGEKLRAGKYEWISLADLLREQGLKVPQLVKSVPEMNAIVIEDYGDTMLQDVVTALLIDGKFEQIQDHYLRCADVIVAFLKTSQQQSARWMGRTFDYEKLHWELDFFVEQYLRPVFADAIDHHDYEQISNEIGKIAEFTASFSKFLVHRDFHSRNVMILQRDAAIIDFQDARTGPATYDVVSLVFDSYVPLSRPQRHQLLQNVSERIKSHFPLNFAKDFDRQLPAVLLQRQLKAIGSFGYLTIKKNKGNYLKYVRPAIETLVDFAPFDERWPLLSGDLLNQIQAKVKDLS